MEIFNVFAKIALRSEEFEEGIVRAINFFERFGKRCQEISENMESAFNEIKNKIWAVVGVMAAFNTTVKFVENLGGAIRGLDKRVGDIISGFQGFGDKVAGASKKLVAFGTKAKAFAAKWLILLGPKILIGAAIGALIGWLVKLIKNNEEVQAKIMAVWERITGFFSEHAGDIKVILQALFNTFQYIFGRIQDVIQLFTDIAKKTWYVFGDTIISSIKIKLTTLKEAFQR